MGPDERPTEQEIAEGQVEYVEKTIKSGVKFVNVSRRLGPGGGSGEATKELEITIVLAHCLFSSGDGVPIPGMMVCRFRGDQDHEILLICLF